MDLNGILKDNCVLVIPNNIKSNVLLELNKLDKLYNIKIMNLNKLIQNLTFTYEKEAIYYLINKYNIKYEVAKVYLDNIRYVDVKDYKIDKLNKLSDIKRELKENNLLKFNSNFKIFLEGKEIIIFGYDHISKYERTIINELEHVSIIKKDVRHYIPTIYEFENIDNEVEFVAVKIIELLNDNVGISNIKLAGVTSEYYSVIERIFKFYNIPINLPNKSSIYDTNIIFDFIKSISEKTIDESLKLINKKYDFNNEENKRIYNSLIKILNEYTFVDDYKKVIDMIIYDLKKTNNYTVNKSNSINIIDIKDNIIDDDIYVFLIGFNQGNIPVINKDEEYLSDKLKEILDIDTSKEKNKLEKAGVINSIRSIKNLIITYKLKTPFDIYYKNSIIDDLNLRVINNIKIENKYSNKMNNIKLANKLDNLIKYGIKESDIDDLYNTYSDTKYMTFDNKFKGIDKNDLNKYLDNKLLLSYSSIDNYYRCPFRYYLNNILKLTDFEESFAINIGNLFHYVLSKCFDKNFDFEKEFSEYAKNLKLTISDKFFMKKLKGELKFIIDTINMQNKFSSLDNASYENKVYINKEGTVKLTFMGVIDKLLYKKENNKTYVVIIDYKTGNPHTNLNNIIYGIDMQLPIYLYLSNNMKEIENIEVIGFYLQKILNSEIVKQKNKTYEKQKRDNLKLQGYSIDNEEELSMFDFSYKDSEVIKSMKVGNNGFYAYSKTISKEKIDKLIDLTERNIDNAFNNILDAKFDIAPKRIGKENVGCLYCKYKDICYMREEDIVNLKEYKNLEFL